jgi:hypothetical protein
MPTPEEILDTLPGLSEKLKRMGLVVDAATASTNASIKASKNSILEQLKEEAARKKLLHYLEEELKLAPKEAQVTAQALKAEQDLIKAKQVAEDHEKKRLETFKKVKGAFDDIVGAASHLASAVMSSQQAAYMSKEVFTGASGTVDLLGTTLKTLIGVVTSFTSALFSSIPIIGGIIDSIGKTGAAIIDLEVQATKIRLERTQAIVNAFNEIAKVGVTFGGDLVKLQQYSADAGLNIQKYSDFLKNSLGDLQSLGGPVNETAVRIAKMGQTILKTNGQLLTMYGSYEAYDGAIAEYHAQLQRYGVDVSTANKNLLGSTTEYLKVQKVLTELTGKSAEQYAKEAKERETNLAYQKALRGAGTAAPVIERAVSMLDQYAGAGAKNVMMEAIGRGLTDIRNVIGPENAALVSQLGPDVVAGMNQVLTQSRLGDTAGAIEGLKQTVTSLSVEGQKNTISELSAAADLKGNLPKFMQGLMEMQSLAMVNEKTLSNLPKAFEEGMKEANAIESEASKKIRDAIDAQIELQKTIDKKAIDDLANVAALVKSLYSIQNQLVDNFPNFGHAVDKFAEYVDRLLGRGPATSGPEASGQVNNGRVVGGAGGEGDAGAIIEAAESAAAQTKLNFKSPEATAGGKSTAALDRAVSAIVSKYPNAVINAMNDKWHQTHKPNSPHTSGNAADFKINGMSDKMASEIEGLLQSLKLKGTAKYEPPSGPENPNGHIHVEAYKNGGITNGPSLAGEAGPEAIIPLPNGRSIPVNMNLTALIDKFDEMIDVLKDNRDYSEKILHATQ